MIGFIVQASVAKMYEIKEEIKRFEELCDSLPPEEAKKLREERKKRLDDELEHRRKLEIAEAGRARNFWGK